MSNGHASYFGQSQPHILPEGDGEQAGTQTGNISTETDPTFTVIRQTRQRESRSEQQGGEHDCEFRRDLVTRIDGIIQDFREQKVAKIEALYQILQVAQEAEVDEEVRQAAIDDYATQVDLIDAQRRTAEQRGEHAAQLVRIEDEPTIATRGEHQRREARRGRSEDEEAGRFLRDLRRQLTRKRRHRTPTESSDSDDDSTAARGEGESNKKKRLYQSQLPWYTVETDAQSREVDENRRKTREILRIFQRDITFAERDVRRATTAPQGFPDSEWRHIFRGEAVNLDIVLSNLHHVAPPKENVGRIGRTEISLGSTDPA
jgi:hypothetical protein